MSAAPAAAPAAPEGVNNAEVLWLNDEVVDMLILLDYENQFCSKELRPISRTFFVYPASNTAYQFKYFTQVIVWCLGFLNMQANWDEYDDPNTVITNILVMLRDAKVQVNAVPGKLKSGYGDSVCQVLHELLKEVLRKTGFEFLQPTYPDEGPEMEAEVDKDAEMNSVDEENMPADVDEDEMMYKEDVLEKPEGHPESDDEDHAVLQTSIDPKEWLLEVERVTPKLKIQMPNDAKEWRNHLSQTRSYKKEMDKEFPPAKLQLDTLSTNLTQALERIRSQESYINTQFDGRTDEYRKQQETLTKVQSEYTDLSEVVVNLQHKLQTVMNELEKVQGDIDERSKAIEDVGPILKMKDAFKRLRTDTRQLEVRIGVVSHTLMQAKLRERPQENRKHGLYHGGPGGGGSDEYEENED